ncbi:right-handed parallel beta-helix repeat-containing protein [candidate division CSSED10-310 bacterium]|uniref:Right-handed parallel beta-helix repeat-containing protein n=1 Tax=candidate division CSSED10-310 bacterium TaxID=2855610 RepID=A0ABV6Z5D7_UNCC1
MKIRISTVIIYLVAGTMLMCTGVACRGPQDGIMSGGGKGENRREVMKRARQDLIGGLPPTILAQQCPEKIEVPALDEAVRTALKAAQETAIPLIDPNFHNKGKVIRVPDNHKTINQAIKAAKSGDVVLVEPGIYYEQLVMKDGVKLVSASNNDGDILIAVEGAGIKLPRRAMRTIIDGSKAQTSKHGMIDFDPGVDRNSIVDGFTIQNLPRQDHHIPGHAHGLNIRGASPVIINCLIRNNGSTGIGNHVVYKDQEKAIEKRDFRTVNVMNQASAVIYNNIIYGNLGLGIGCNHLSTPFILGNEVFNNSDAELGEDPSPGLGNKHGSAATIIGNIVHNNPGGGILCKVGAPQGIHSIDRPTFPTIKMNVVYNNGQLRPAISCNGAGSEQMPVRIIGNYVFHSGLVGIALRDGARAIIEENMVSDSKLPGIAIRASKALKLNRNKVTRSREAPGFAIVKGAVVLEMVGNASDSNKGPRFMLKNGTIPEKVTYLKIRANPIFRSS